MVSSVVAANARTDASGVVAFETVSGAVMKLELDYNGAKYMTEAVTVNGNTQLEITTLPYSLQLKDSNDQPLENVRINLRRANDSYITNARTDENGVATFEVVPNAELKFEVDYNGAKHATDTKQVSAATTVIVQTLPYTLSLRDSHHTPLKNVRINLRRENNSYITNNRTDENGIATFEVVPNAELKFEVDYNGSKYSTDTQTISETRTIEVQTLPLIVSLTAGGLPLTNQRVDLLRANDSYITNARTDSEGTVVFEVVPGASHKVRVKHDGETWVSEEVGGGRAVKSGF